MVLCKEVLTLETEIENKEVRFGMFVIPVYTYLGVLVTPLTCRPGVSSTELTYGLKVLLN